MIKTVSTYTCDQCHGVTNHEGYDAPRQWVTVYPSEFAPEVGFCSWACVRAHADQIIRKQQLDEGDE